MSIICSELSVSAYTPDHFVNGTASSDTFKEFKGIWDTGATCSVITQNVVDALGLVPVDMVTVHHAQGSSVVEVYLVDFGLPNKVGIPMLRVTKGVLKDFDVLIGMDVISRGDFAVSNFNGRTAFSFRMPSQADADYTGKVPSAAPAKAGRNDPCPCGSGRKYKKCCGAVL